MSGARSDDGKIAKSDEYEFYDSRELVRMRKTLEVNSVTAELSAHEPHWVRLGGDQPISERPDESEHPSSPAGTIGEEPYDIMSENIQTLKRKNKSYGKQSLNK